MRPSEVYEWPPQGDSQILSTLYWSCVHIDPNQRKSFKEILDEGILDECILQALFPMVNITMQIGDVFERLLCFVFFGVVEL